MAALLHLLELLVLSLLRVVLLGEDVQQVEEWPVVLEELEHIMGVQVQLEIMEAAMIMVVVVVVVQVVEVQAVLHLLHRMQQVVLAEWVVQELILEAQEALSQNPN